jgi:hypothetical protein
MLSVILLNVVMLNAVAPRKMLECLILASIYSLLSCLQVRPGTTQGKVFHTRVAFWTCLKH